MHQDIQAGMVKGAAVGLRRERKIYSIELVYLFVPNSTIHVVNVAEDDLQNFG